MPRFRCPRGYRTYHGPVESRPYQGNIQVITFTGSEESDLLHAAGSWMADHLDALLTSINWVGDFLSPHGIDSHASAGDDSGRSGLQDHPAAPHQRPSRRGTRAARWPEPSGATA